MLELARASKPVGNTLGLTVIDSSANASARINAISDDANAVIDFETSRLPVDFTKPTSTLLTEIIQAAEDLLCSDSAKNLTATNSPVTNGNANTDSLLVFYEASGQGTTQDAVIIRYQEGAADAPFDNELSVVAIFEGVSSGSFDSANIV